MARVVNFQSAAYIPMYGSPPYEYLTLSTFIELHGVFLTAFSGLDGFSVSMRPRPTTAALIHPGI